MHSISKEATIKYIKENNIKPVSIGTKFRGKKSIIEITSGPIFNERKQELFYMSKYHYQNDLGVVESSIKHSDISKFEKMGIK